MEQTLEKKTINFTTDYKKHFDNGPIPTWVVDAQTLQFLVVNQAAIEKYGYSREEFSRMTIKEIRPEEDIASLLEMCARKTAYYDGGYRRHLKKDGTVFYVHIYTHITQFGDRDARLCFAVDVDDKLKTDQRNRELMELLRSQKDELDEILLSINDAIWSRTADTHRLIYGNKAYYELHGLQPDEMDEDMGYIMNSVYPPDKEIMLEAIREVQSVGKTEVIYRHVLPGGSIRTLKVHAVFKKGIDPRPDIIMGISTDITQEKALFDALRDTEQKLLATINNTKDLIWSVDKTLKITFCNTAYQDFFLKRSGVALDKGDFVLGNWLSESFITKRKKDYERALHGETFVTIVEEYFNGSLQYNEISSNPVIDHDGKIIGVNCISRDISAQRKQLINIREQNEKLKDIARKKIQKVRSEISAHLVSVSFSPPVLEENDVNLLVREQLNNAIKNLEDIINDMIAVSKNIDASYPDTEDIISRL